MNLSTARDLQSSMDLCYGRDLDRVAAAREVFATLALTAANLAYDFGQLPADRTLDAVCDASREAWMLALDGSFTDFVSEDRATAA